MKRFRAVGEMQESADGKYVLYQDHADALSALKKEWDLLAAAVREELGEHAVGDILSELQDSK